MADVGSLSHEVCDITSCSICLETLKEPKVLPCIHTFCLQCLDKHCESRSKEEEASCPLCRIVFAIPPDGIQDLPDNFFVRQLLNFNKSTVATRTHDQILCELCSDSEAEVKATCFCIECDQHICDRCFGIHKKAKALKSHRVVRDENIPGSEERIKLADSYCNQHPGEKHTLYCYDCHVIMCLKCMSNHSQHKLSDVNESAEKFSQQLNEDITKVAACELHQLANLKQIDLSRERFIHKVASAESEILQKYDDLISLLQSHKSQLMEELNQFRDKVVKQIEIKKDEIERQFVISESFKTYCLAVMNKGSACDISRTAHDLHARAEELVKTQEEPDSHRPSEVEITFKPLLSTTDHIKNVIGELVFRGEADDTKEYQMKENALTRFFTKPRLLHVMPTSGQWITGITVLGNKVYVVRDTSNVYVYKSNDFTLKRKFTIAGSRQLRGLIACSHYNCLYATDCEEMIIYRYGLTRKVPTSWSVDDKCTGLSVTKCYNVLVSLCFSQLIQEYTTRGRLIKSINLDTSSIFPWHSVQLSTENYVVSYLGEPLRVVMMNQDGHIIHSYDESSGSGVLPLFFPRHLAVDIHDNVLVADWYNNSVQILSPTLTYLGDITMHDYEINHPRALHFDKLNNRLYIGEGEGGRMFILEVEINNGL